MATGKIDNEKWAGRKKATQSNCPEKTAAVL